MDRQLSENVVGLSNRRQCICLFGVCQSAGMDVALVLRWFTFKCHEDRGGSADHICDPILLHPFDLAIARIVVKCSLARDVARQPVFIQL